MNKENAIPYNDETYVLNCFNSRENLTKLITARRIAHDNKEELIAYLIDGTILLNDYHDPKYSSGSYMLEYADEHFRLVMKRVNIISWKSFILIMSGLKQRVGIKTNFDKRQKILCQCGCKNDIYRDLDTCHYDETLIEVVADEEMPGISADEFIIQLNKETGIHYEFLHILDQQGDKKDPPIVVGDRIHLRAHYYFWEHHYSHLKKMEEEALKNHRFDYERQENLFEYGKHGHKHTFKSWRGPIFTLQFGKNGYLFIDISKINLTNVCQEDLVIKDFGSALNRNDLLQKLFGDTYKLNGNMLVVPGSRKDLGNLDKVCKYLNKG